MTLWTIVFFAVALVAGIFGFTGISAASAGIAQILCVLFLGLGICAFALRFIVSNDEETERERT